ncbi:hypothetical protein BDP55DRAFT_683817 [Colletotrichum godetiae]|uniref:Uncharacterized protein n=1 Tax=Colletotrichum godetiae TaxID=1209918 RepID=A0AAJ0A7V3_9PEZI|nr:uncharacterized protein BDP55DRAFT_683817 [Colletotrichum godetiae]KAK1658100.1 hypothetical protein BDP55DRAFT_683817 [Colletotrichum godetiae]
MRLGGVEYFETPDDAAACPEAHIYFLGSQREVLLSQQVNITNSSTTCSSKLLQAISLPAGLEATYAKVTFLCGNDDGPSCQMIRLLPSDASNSAATLPLAMTRTCLDSSITTAASIPSDATGTASVPWNGTSPTTVANLPTSVNEEGPVSPTPSTEIQPIPPYSYTGTETDGIGVSSTWLGLDTETIRPTSITTDISLTSSETAASPTTLIDNTSSTVGSVPTGSSLEVPPGGSSGFPGATTLMTSTVSSITPAPRCTCEPS